jgi:hypothetical protein
VSRCRSPMRACARYNRHRQGKVSQPNQDRREGT